MKRTASLTRSQLPRRSSPMTRTPFPSSPPSVAGRAGLRAVTRPDHASKAGVREHPARTSSAPGGTIPPKVRALVNARDPWCVRCGEPCGLEMHHRRLKGHGGDPRAHTDCPCNLVNLHLGCHLEVHRGDRREAEAEGFIVPAEILLPGSVSVLVRTADGGLEKFPSCDGQWLDAPGSEAA